MSGNPAVHVKCVTWRYSIDQPNTAPTVSLLPIHFPNCTNLLHVVLDLNTKGKAVEGEGSVGASGWKALELLTVFSRVKSSSSRRTIGISAGCKVAASSPALLCRAVEDCAVCSALMCSAVQCCVVLCSVV